MAANQGNRGGVTKGSLWDSKTPAYSKETQDLMKVMMKESKLTSFQQKQLSNALKGGSALPVRCNPTSSDDSPKKTPAPKAKEVRLASPGGVRTREAIESSGAYERPKYKPSYSKSKEKDKQKLQNIMAFGKDLPEPTPAEKAALLREPSPEPEVDRFEELEREIRERADFLEDMKALGKEKQYLPIVNTEISQRVREMEIIDAERTKKLQRAMSEQGRPSSKNH